MAARIYTPGMPSFVDVDRAMWDWNPVMGDPNKSSAPEKAGQGRFYAGGSGVTIPAPGGFAGMVQKIKNYVVTRGTVLDNQAADPGVPARPTLTYVGAAGFPADGLRFRTTPYSDPQANPFAAMEWRLAEITNPSAPGYDPKAPKKYEIDALWESGELTTFNNEITVPARYVEAGKD